MLNVWESWIDDYVAWMIAASVAASTLRIYTHYLRRLALFVDSEPAVVTVDDLAEFLAARQWAAETRKSARAAMRSFYGWAALTSRIERDPSRLLRPVRVPAGVPRPAPDDVVMHALVVANPRDRLMVMLAAYAGLRRAEIAKVHTADVVAGELLVHGKGGKTRMVPLHPALAAALGRCEDGYVFPGKIDGHLSPHWVGKSLSRLLGPGWTGHTLRHRFLSRAYAAERDLRAAQQLAGHSKPETTARYTAIVDGALQRAVLAAGPAA